MPRRDSQHLFVPAQQLPALQVRPLLEAPRVAQGQAGEEARHVEPRGALGVPVRRCEKRRDVTLHRALPLDAVVPDAQIVTPRRAQAPQRLAQRDMVRKATGKNAEALELSAQELEERIAPPQAFPNDLA